MVAIQSSIRVVDVTHDNRGQVAKTGEDDDEEEDVDDAASLRSKASIKGVEEKSLLVALPKQLLQFDVKVPTEDKDIYTYYYLLRVSPHFLLQQHYSCLRLLSNHTLQLPLGHRVE